MITLPEKFQTFANKGAPTPATIVKFGDSLLENTQGTQADWENNSSESQVDYATSPSNVVLGIDTIPDIEQLTEDHVLTSSDASNIRIPKVVERYRLWQSFKQTTGSNKVLDTVSLGYEISVTGSATLYCALYDAKEGTKLSTTISVNKTTGTHFAEFDFSGDSVGLVNNVTYWIYSWSTINAPYVAVLPLDTVKFQYTTTTSAYSDGQLDFESMTGGSDLINAGDAKFSIGMTGNYYYTSGNITTQIIDLGETPAANGEWKFNDTTPSNYGTTAVAYTCFGSTDNFVSSNVSIGTKVDGDTIETGDWYRYYKITSSLSTTDKNESPSVHDVGLSFVTYQTFTNRNIFGYEQALDGISSLSTKIDDFDRSTVSQITCNLGLTETISNYLFSNFPKNKPAKVLIGFVDPDFLESDFFELYVGAIDDWKISANNYVSITVKDTSKLWSVDVPKEITASEGNETSGTYQALTFSADHPVDAMLEILQNHLDIRDAVIDTGSFEAVKTSLSGWEITRDFDGPPVEIEKADDLLNELRILTSTYFIPDATGKIKLKEYDSTESAVETLTDDDFLKPLSWESNIGAMLNKTFHQFDWDTVNEEYDHVYIAFDATSIGNNDETATYEFEDKWTLTADVAQVQAMKTNILARYAAPPAKLTGTLDRKKLYLEVGDMVNITTTQAPSTDLSGIADTKFQITEKTFNQGSDTIKFVFLEV